MSTMAALILAPASVPLIIAMVSAISVDRQTLLITVELQIIGWIVAREALTTSAGARQMKTPCWLLFLPKHLA